MARPLNALPRSLSFPFGYTVKIKLATPTECKAQETPETPVVNGWWDEDGPVIYIRSTLKPAQKRYILGHEMHHAVIDWVHQMLDQGIMVPTKQK